MTGCVHCYDRDYDELKRDMSKYQEEGGRPGDELAAVAKIDEVRQGGEGIPSRSPKLGLPRRYIRVGRYPVAASEHDVADARRRFGSFSRYSRRGYG